jgi:hypothetical protein
MKKKHQVFISSTYTDLKTERQAAVEAVLKAGHIPAGMELFKAGREQMETIKQWIDESDVYLLLLGKRYGSIDKETGKSYTELEYRYAMEEKKMPGFAIILNESMVDEKVKAGPLKREELYESDNQKLYQEFETYVKSKVVGYAGSLDGIKSEIHANLNKIKDEYNLVGWVRGDTVEQYIVSNLIDYAKEILKSCLQGDGNLFTRDFVDENRYYSSAITSLATYTVTPGNGMYNILRKAIWQLVVFDLITTDNSYRVINRCNYQAFRLTEYAHKIAQYLEKDA